MSTSADATSFASPADVPLPDSSGFGGARDQRGRGGPAQQANRGLRDQSVVDTAANGGGANVSGGVARRKRRQIAGLAQSALHPVAKSYNASDAVLFNNYDELLQDKVSRVYAQEILEEFFGECDVDVTNPDVAKYAEDATFMFLIATTASNKADYDRQVDLPGAGELDFSKLSYVLQYNHGLTRRNFARGLADSLRGFLRRPENKHIIPAVSTRVGCDPQFGHLAFDGSTHCSNMTTREVSFTRTLEARNLFESDDVLAAGASDRLMQGMPSGTRSNVPR